MVESVKGIDRNHDGRSRALREIEEAQRQGVELGVLSRAGARRGFVAYMPAKVFGRVMFEVTGRLNDVLCQLEMSTVAYASEMDLESWQKYHRVVDEQLEGVRKEMDRLIQLCGYGIRGEYEEGVLAVMTEPDKEGQKKGAGEGSEVAL